MAKPMEQSALHLMHQMDAWPLLQDFCGRGLDVHAYQIESVLKVVNQLEGRAILADEVGLGKTIEAGLAIAELKARQLVDRVLILVPAGLISQWIAELHDKFGWQALGLKMSAAARPNNTAALMPPAAAVRPPVKSPKIPRDLTAVAIPSTSV